MKSIVFVLFWILVSCSTVSNNNEIHSSNALIQEKKIADFYILFQSVCCGPTPLEPFVVYSENFLRPQSLEFYTIEKVSGLGLEGEYMLLLYVNDWTENQKQKYFDGLQKIQWESRNSNSFGGVEVGTDYNKKRLANIEGVKISEIKWEDLK